MSHNADRIMSRVIKQNEYFFNRVNRRDYFLNRALTVNALLMHIVNYRNPFSLVSCAKTAEPIEMQFEMLSRFGPGNTH